jgi:uncharacterized membrane protein YbhN (UPF0104 family)
VTVKRPGILQRIFPWLVALVLLVTLFRVVDPAALTDALRQVAPGAWIALVLAFVLAVLASDSFATWILYRQSLPGVPLGYVETFKLRGATYLLAIIHYGAGQAGMAYFLKTRHDVPLSRAAGAAMLTMGTNALTVAGCAGLGVLLGGAPASPAVRLVLYATAAALPAYLLVIAWAPRFLAGVPLLAPLFAAGVRGHLVISAARLPHIAVLVAGHFAAMRLFGIAVPAADALALLPLVFIVGVLPISPSGLGTAQAMAVALFAVHAPGASQDARQATVLAYSLALQISTVLVQALVGLVCLRTQAEGAYPRER